MREKKHEDKGWKPETDGGQEAVANDDRCATTFGESGQFAPGGYYNQQGINKPDRRTIDDDIVPPGRH